MVISGAEAGPINSATDTNILQNFSDATAGRSQQLFYVMGVTDSTGVEYVLGRDAGISLPIDMRDVGGGGVTTFDADITINKPTIMAGIATIDFNYKHMEGGSEGGTNSIFIFKLIHYDGITETTIGTVTAQTVAGVSQTGSFKLKCQITKKLFGIGNILRLNTSISYSGTSPRYSVVSCDPETAGNELKLWMPIVNLE